MGLERLSPLADVAIGGLLVGTVLTLIYIPLFAYTVDGGQADTRRERLSASITV